MRNDEWLYSSTTASGVVGQADGIPPLPFVGEELGMMKGEELWGGGEIVEKLLKRPPRERPFCVEKWGWG